MRINNNPSGRDNERKAKGSAARMLSARPMTKARLREKLIEKGFSEDTAFRTVSWLEEMGYINDVEYANIKAKSLFAKGYGRRRVFMELKRRGVGEEDIEEALAGLDDVYEPDKAMDALIEKRLRGKNLDSKQMKGLFDHLYRKGYGWDEIKKSVARYLDNLDEIEDETYG